MQTAAEITRKQSDAQQAFEKARRDWLGPDLDEEQPKQRGAER